MMSPYKTLNQTLQIKYIYILEREGAESFYEEVFLAFLSGLVGVSVVILDRFFLSQYDL